MWRIRRVHIVKPGDKFNYLTVLRALPPHERALIPKYKDRKILWECVCDCGVITNLPSFLIADGKVKTCGCGVLSTGGHRLLGTPTYVSWMAMKARCNNPKHEAYARYGGRGIKVCGEWMHDFAAFLRDVGERPSTDYQLERIDNNGNYEPGNVRWATRVEQWRNRSTNRLITHDGITKTLFEWAEEFKIHPNRLAHRLDLTNQVLSEAIKIPIRKYKRRETIDLSKS